MPITCYLFDVLYYLTDKHISSHNTKAVLTEIQPMITITETVSSFPFLIDPGLGEANWHPVFQDYLELR